VNISTPVIYLAFDRLATRRRRAALPDTQGLTEADNPT
jgi:hypothetical protein